MKLRSDRKIRKRVHENPTPKKMMQTVKMVGTVNGKPIWVYRLHEKHTSKPYYSEASAKAQMARHIKRGGLSQEWFRRNNVSS
jgi:hypothetical protein